MKLFGKCARQLGLFSAVTLTTACGQREAIDLIIGNPLPSTNPVPNLFNFLPRQNFNQTPNLTSIIYDGTSQLLQGSRQGFAGFEEIPDVDGPQLLELPMEPNANDPQLHWTQERLLEGSNGELTFTARLHHNGIPVFGSSVRQHRDAKGVLWLSGRVPDFLLVEGAQPQAEPFRSLPLTLASRASAYLHYSIERWSTGERQYVAYGEKLRPAWLFVVEGGKDAPGRGPDVPMKLLLDDETGAVLVSEALAFDMDGTATMYMENAVADNNTKTQVTFPYLLGDGSRLESDYWRVKNCNLQAPSSTACLQQASGTAGDYSAYALDPNSNSNYDELVSYHAIARAFAWNTNIMNEAGVAAGDRKDSWGASRSTLGLASATKLQIFVRAPTSNSSGGLNFNNAQYLPCGVSGKCDAGPWIVIGTGWEAGRSIAGTSDSSLRYIGKDADVVMHEFNHHIIFRSLTTTEGETGAMHEGIADYMTYAITGNNLLGESIVPPSSNALRAGRVTGKIANYVNASIHKKGEFMSSVLWDVREALGDWKNGYYKADKIIWDALDLCTESETFYGFIGAMAKATDAFAAAHGDNAADLRQKIFTVFYDRGFIQKPTSPMTLPKATSYISGTSGSGSSKSGSSKRSSESSGWCSVASEGGATSPWLNLLLLLSAMALPAVGMKRRQEMKRRRASTPCTRRSEHSRR
jgi:hypothetical protein